MQMEIPTAMIPLNTFKFLCFRQHRLGHTKHDTMCVCVCVWVGRGEGGRWLGWKGWERGRQEGRKKGERKWLLEPKWPYLICKADKRNCIENVWPGWFITSAVNKRCNIELSTCWRTTIIYYLVTLVVQLCVERYGLPSVKYLMVIARAMYTQQTTARKLEKDGKEIVIDSLRQPTDRELQEQNRDWGRRRPDVAEYTYSPHPEPWIDEEQCSYGDGEPSVHKP